MYILYNLANWQSTKALAPKGYGGESPALVCLSCLCKGFFPLYSWVLETGGGHHGDYMLLVMRLGMISDAGRQLPHQHLHSILPPSFLWPNHCHYHSFPHLVLLACLKLHKKRTELQNQIKALNALNFGQGIKDPRLGKTTKTSI